jgi:hypothetical protein
VEFERRKQEALKAKNCWREFKRFLFCEGGNYIDELEYLERHSYRDGCSQGGRMEPWLDGTISSHENLFLVDFPTEESQVREIRLKRTHKKNANSLNVSEGGAGGGGEGNNQRANVGSAQTVAVEGAL